MYVQYNYDRDGCVVGARVRWGRLSRMRQALIAHVA